MDNKYKNYIKGMFLNEYLSSNHNEDILNIIKSSGAVINTDFNNMYIIITGASSVVLKNKFNISFEENLIYINEIRKRIDNFLSENKCEFDIFFNIYNADKKIICFIQNKKDINIADIATKIHDIAITVYTENIKKFTESYMQLTAMSNLISDKNNVFFEFQKTFNISNLKFFAKDLKIINHKIYNNLKERVPYDLVYNLSNEIVVNVLDNDIENIIKNCNRLFMDILSKTFSITLCKEILIKIKISLYGLIHNMDFDSDIELDDLFMIENYISIEILCEKLANEFINISKILKSKKIYSEIINRAVEHIDCNFKDNISLSKLSEIVHVSPNYLSKIFNLEVGMSIPRYINEKKLEYAKMMIRTTDEKIVNIAEEIGIFPYKRFSAMFKKIYGITPIEYKKNNSNV